MCVGVMQERKIAIRRQVIGRLAFGVHQVRGQRKVEACHAGSGHELQEFTPRAHFQGSFAAGRLTGEAASNRKAITSFIWASVRMPRCPKRGMFEHGAWLFEL